VYRERAVPDLAGHYLCGDIVNGRIFHVPVDELHSGGTATLRELGLRKGGKAVTLLGLVGKSAKRVNLRFDQDAAGEIYIITKQDGRIHRLKSA
jgi:hypothetical protein